MTRIEKMTGSKLQDMIVEAAHPLGYKAAHFRGGLRKDGSYRTPVQYDAKGFPDLILVKGTLGIAFECKAEDEKVSAAQDEWIRWWREVGFIAYVVRPSDWDEIVKILMGKRE